jgi:hypothetical protein
MAFRSSEYQRGYDAGYKAALLDALKQQPQPQSEMIYGPGPHRRLDILTTKLGGPHRRLDILTTKLGGPDAPYKQTDEWKREHGGELGVPIVPRSKRP